MNPKKELKKHNMDKRKKKNIFKKRQKSMGKISGSSKIKSTKIEKYLVKLTITN